MHFYIRQITLLKNIKRNGEYDELIIYLFVLIFLILHFKLISTKLTLIKEENAFIFLRSLYIFMDKLSC